MAIVQLTLFVRPHAVGVFPDVINAERRIHFRTAASQMNGASPLTTFEFTSGRILSAEVIIAEGTPLAVGHVLQPAILRRERAGPVNTHFPTV